MQTRNSQYITSLSYNDDAQLAAVNAAGGALASYTYDGFGQRLLTALPTDAQDACYMEHDKCYSQSRKMNGTCDSNKATHDTQTCDRKLAQCLSGLTLIHPAVTTRLLALSQPSYGSTQRPHGSP
jgi:YD repeat-containing protein